MKKILGLFIAIILIGSAIYVLYSKYNTPDISDKQEIQKNAINTDAQIQQLITEGKVKEFKSNDLGISFKYPSSIEKIFKVTGTNVQVGTDEVTIYNKRADQTLKQAIEGQFLSGYNLNDCWVDITERNGKSEGTLKFKWPKEDADLGEISEASKVCPLAYTSVGGLVYFMADPNVPDKFAFFEIGQDEEMLTDEIPWRGTFEFLKK